MTPWLLAALLALRPGGDLPARPSVHDLHLTHTRMVIEGTTVACRVRVFRDDLQAALRQFSGKADLTLTDVAHQDSLFGAYAAVHLTLRADGERLTSGSRSPAPRHDPTSQETLWYVLEAEAPRPITRLGVLNGLMFELYRDQQNLVQVLRLPQDARQTLYFAATDPREQVI